MEEEKVIIKLHKQPLSSERKEQSAKRKRIVLIVLLCFMMLVTGLIGGYAFAGISRGSSIAAFKKDKFDKIIAYFNEAWLYKNDYESLEETMEDKAFYGMTSFSEDKYSSYMSNEEVTEFQTSINQSFVGIGAKFTYNNEVGLIVDVYENSPAEKCGMMAGDIIYKVDDEEVAGLDSDQIKEKIQGIEGTQVKITVKRANEEIDLYATRGPVSHTAYAKDINGICYLEILSFGETTADECINYLDNFTNYSKLIIDLRDNTGGYQDAVQNVAGLFLGEGKVCLKETNNKNETTSFYTICKKYYENFKDIVVLTNGNTASAAEVLTITLKELHPNATQIGETTFGKGVVQSTYYLSDMSALKITTNYWTSPNDVSINGVGVIPDKEVKLDDVFYENFYLIKDQTFEYDSVSTYNALMQKALKFLGYKIDRVDGYFDESFKEALLEFKTENKFLDDDSVLDYDTYYTIISSITRIKDQDMSKDNQLMYALDYMR